MKVLLFRHGIAGEPDEWDGKESDRPLTEKGKKRTKQSAEGLAIAGVGPSQILTSPLVRARATADILQSVFHLRTPARLADELMPDAPPDKLLPLLGTLPPDAVVVCVGHEPHLGAAAGLLLGGKPTMGLSLKKAGACLILFEETPRAGKGQLEWWLPPSLLRGLR